MKFIKKIYKIINYKSFLLFIYFRSSRRDNVTLVNIITLVELATTLVCIAILNSSLALLAGAAYVPIVLLIKPRDEKSTKLRKLLSLFWIILHPFVLSSIVIMTYTYVNFSEENLTTLAIRGLDATKKSFVFSIIDSMIYGNWLFNVTTAVLLPIWILLSNVISNSTNNMTNKF